MGFLRAPRRDRPENHDAPGSGIDAPSAAADSAPADVTQEPAADVAPETATPEPAPEPAASSHDETPSPAPEHDGTVDVEVMGNGFQVDGTLTTGLFGRLSDWLNMQQGWFRLENGALVRPGEKLDPERSRCDQWIRLDEVVLVSERRAPVRNRAADNYVRKERRRVTIVTRGYTLRGHMHLVEAGAMEAFLESSDPRFLPMTDVVVRRLEDETLISHHPFALINRSQLISVSEEAPRRETEESGEPPALPRTA